MDANVVHDRAGPLSWESGWVLGSLLLATFLIRAVGSSQPLVENYVGRQVPTAMVARNLDRGSGFLWPQLDTAPFPNYFLVEPPLYEACVVLLKRATGMGLTEAGRVFSAFATALAAWGLYQLALPRDGARTALLAVAALAIFPLTIRYGRAFQPDASMVGALVAGLACWDRHQSRPHRFWFVAGWLLLALGLALKITAAFLLVPLVFGIFRSRRLAAVLAALSTLLPALLWYVWAFHLLEAPGGSRAAAQNQSIWLGLLRPSALVKPETLKSVGWFLVVRAFTPIGAGLALFGLWNAGRANRDCGGLWWIWGISGLAAMAVLADKLHHEYYWLTLAPVAAVGVARAVVRLAGFHRTASIAVTAILLLLCSWQVRTTWQTPREWTDLEQAADSVKTIVPRGAWLAAPEALLFHADRRGCRMELTRPAVKRAAGEWPTGTEVADPLDLIDHYRRHGARYFADLGSRADASHRMGLHDAIRRRYKVIVDSPHVLIADLSAPGAHWNAN
jgi:4-amino-4-deoxy-L-arabinose transferase-like glycosyltransferase